MSEVSRYTSCFLLSLRSKNFTIKYGFVVFTLQQNQVANYNLSNEGKTRSFFATLRQGATEHRKGAWETCTTYLVESLRSPRHARSPPPWRWSRKRRSIVPSDASRVLNPMHASCARCSRTWLNSMPIPFRLPHPTTIYGIAPSSSSLPIVGCAGISTTTYCALLKNACEPASKKVSR